MRWWVSPTTNRSSGPSATRARSIRHWAGWRSWASSTITCAAWGEAWTDTGLVFVREDGQAYHPQRLAQLFDQHRRAAGLPKLGIHGPRHSYATAGLESGTELKVMSARLGHSSIAITADTYSHVLDHVDQAAADRTAAFIFGM